jgi:hypothetical protein
MQQISEGAQRAPDDQGATEHDAALARRQLTGTPYS